MAYWEAAVRAEMTGMIRRRPAMYVGSATRDGVEQMLFAVVASTIKQTASKQSTNVRVERLSGGWVTVEGDGEPLPIHPSAEFEVSELELIFTSVHSSATQAWDTPGGFITNMTNVGLSVVNALSSRLEVETRRDGIAYAAAFERGIAVEPVHELGPTTTRGTLIRYLADPQIFGDAQLDEDDIEARLTDLAWLLPQAEISFQGTALSDRTGLLGWVRNLAGPTLDEASLISGRQTFNDIIVDFALAHRTTPAPESITSFVNFIRTESGSHVRGLQSVLQKLGHHDSGIVAVLHVGMLHPRFQGPTRAVLFMDEARHAVETVVEQALANSWWAR